MARWIILRNVSLMVGAVLFDRSLQDKEVLLREIHHRVKNNMQMILSIVHLQSDEEDPEAFRGSLESRINAMATVHEMLYESPDVATVEVAVFLERLAETAVQSTTCNGRPPWITTKVPDVRLPIEQVVPLGLIASELITNACKYGASADGSVTVEIEMKKHEQDLELIVRDHDRIIPLWRRYRSRYGGRYLNPLSPCTVSPARRKLRYSSSVAAVTVAFLLVP
jgi:two-component sensor histidine kinase